MKSVYIKPSIAVVDMDAEELMTILPASGDTSGAVGAARNEVCWDDAEGEEQDNGFEWK